MPRLTKASHEADLQSAKTRSYNEGYEYGLVAREQLLKEQFQSAKLQQLQAAAKLMEECGRMASRIGYMVGKINGENGR